MHQKEKSMLSPKKKKKWRKGDCDPFNPKTKFIEFSCNARKRYNFLDLHVYYKQKFPHIIAMYMLHIFWQIIKDINQCTSLFLKEIQFTSLVEFHIYQLHNVFSLEKNYIM